MRARTILALVSSPMYGLQISLVIIPLTLLIGLVTLIAAGTSPWMALGAILASIVFSAAVYAQCARYAGSWTKLQPLSEQPTFFLSVRRCLVVTIIVYIFGFLFGFAFVLVLKQFGGAGMWWWMDAGKLAGALDVAMRTPTRGDDIFSFQNMNVGSLLFVFTLASMFFIMVLAVFAIPRAVGLGRGYGEAYTVELILIRLFVAVPVLALISVIESAAVLGLFELASVNVFKNDVLSAILTLYLETTLFTGMIFAFEAMILRSAYRPAAEQAGWQPAGPQVGTPDFRALRESWNDRS